MGELLYFELIIHIFRKDDKEMTQADLDYIKADMERNGYEWDDPLDEICSDPKPADRKCHHPHVSFPYSNEKFICVEGDWYDEYVESVDNLGVFSHMEFFQEFASELLDEEWDLDVSREFYNTYGYKFEVESIERV
jgi:hypothetical protein